MMAVNKTTETPWKKPTLPAPWCRTDLRNCRRPHSCCQTTPSGDLVVATLADPPTHHKDPSWNKPGAYATGTIKFSSNHPEWFWGYIAHHHNFYLKAAVCTKDYHAGALKAVRALTVRTESAVNRNSGNDRQFPHEKRQNISEEGLKNQIASTDITWWLPLLISIYQL